MARVSHILVGLNRIGLVGLRKAIEAVDAAGLTERDDVVATMMDELAGGNYISAASIDLYRQALWREYLRHRGEDIRHLYSAIDVVVRARPGPDLDRLCEVLVEVFARHELRPITTIEPPSEDGPHPQVLIDDEIVAAGTTDPDRLAQRIGKQISHW